MYNKNVLPRVDFNEEKNLLLKATRGVNFEDVIQAIEKNKVLDDIKHTSKKRQRVMVIKIRNYAYAVPYVLDKEKGTIFLKTMYPSRVLTRKYLKEKEEYEK